MHMHNHNICFVGCQFEPHGSYSIDTMVIELREINKKKNNMDKYNVVAVVIFTKSDISVTMWHTRHVHVVL